MLDALKAQLHPVTSERRTAGRTPCGSCGDDSVLFCTSRHTAGPHSHSTSATVEGVLRRPTRTVKKSLSSAQAPKLANKTTTTTPTEAEGEEEGMVVDDVWRLSFTFEMVIRIFNISSVKSVKTSTRESVANNRMRPWGWLLLLVPLLAEGKISKLQLWRERRHYFTVSSFGLLQVHLTFQCVCVVLCVCACFHSSHSSRQIMQILSSLQKYTRRHRRLLHGR
jgi:hypothetical protein